jgi:hypothetical protein
VTRLSPATLALAALVAATLVIRPLVHGVEAATILVFWATTLGQVVLPGVLLVRGARLCAADAWLQLGQGATLGLALQGLALLAGRALGAPWLPTLVALAAAGLGLGLAQRGLRPPRGVAPLALAPTLAFALAAVLLQPLSSTRRLGEPVPFDLLFHAGTAAELRHRWPLEDPRVAGVPLHYHVLAYALPLEAAELSGAPLADPLLGTAPLFWVGLLALQLANAGRVIFGDGRAGALGSAVALFHADAGQLLGLGPGAFNSHLATAIFGSPTTVCGFILLLGLALALEGWVETGKRRELAAFGLLAVAASAAKTTVLPVVLGGLALACARALRLRRASEARAWLAALAVGAAAGAPFTLWQTIDSASYSRMAHFGIGTAFTSSGFAASAAAWFGQQALSGAQALLVLPLWLVGWFGLAGVAAACWLALRQGSLRPTQAWVLAVAAVALLTSLLMDTPDLSQLFLLYNGLLLLCLCAGAGLAQALPPRRGPAAGVLAVVLVLAAVPSVVKLARGLPAAVASDAASRTWTPPGAAVEYGQALAWLRTHASRDAVVFADNPSMLLTAFGELRLFYETGLYTARARAVGPGREPWPERAALQERLLRRPDRAAVDEARRAIGGGRRLLVVADAVQSRVESGFVLTAIGTVPGRRLFPEALFELRFANRTLHVYEARDESGRVSPR